jgi:hypothetical protein
VPTVTARTERASESPASPPPHVCCETANPDAPHPKAFRKLPLHHGLRLRRELHSRVLNSVALSRVASRLGRRCRAKSGFSLLARNGPGAIRVFGKFAHMHAHGSACLHVATAVAGLFAFRRSRERAVRPTEHGWQEQNREESQPAQRSQLSSVHGEIVVRRRTWGR